MPDEVEPDSPEVRELKLETARLERDIKVADLRQRNWNLDHPPTSFSSMIRSPIVAVGVFAALGTLAGTTLTYLNALAQRETDRQRIEVATILEMLKTSNPEAAINNLKFAVDAGLIRSNAPNLAAYLKGLSSVPALPPPTQKPPHSN